MFFSIQQKFIKLSGQFWHRQFYGRAFSVGDSIKRVLIVYDPNRISFAQIYPFLFYRNEFRAQFSVEFRFANYHDVVGNYVVKSKDADVVLFQTWFTVSPDALQQLIANIRENNSRAKLHFLDSFAPTDLRLGKYLDGHIESYVKKTLLRDRSQYQTAFCGGTNLVDYYSKLYSLDEAPVDWGVPSSLVEKITLSPTFLTGPEFLDNLVHRELPNVRGRSVDLHARLAVGGSAWYSNMRKSSEIAIENLSGVSAITGVGVKHRQFIKEMKSSKLCFSPFGYGEICWRDIEAVVSGCVLIKPDMGHLDMDPMVHIPNETYVPVKWDFSDVEDKVMALLQDEDLRCHIAENAYNLLRRYVVSKEFVGKFAYLFA